MLTVQLSISICALIPPAVLILAVSAVLPNTGRLHNAFESTVGKILFAEVPGAPAVTFIKAVLALLSTIALFVGISVYNSDYAAVITANMPLDKQILLQAKGWRNQRNLYLSLLALALWWTVYTVFVYKTKINALVQQLEHQNGSAGPKAANNNPKAATSSSAANKSPAADEEHEVAEPIGSNKKKEGIAQRKAPKPSAPELD